MTIEIFRDIAGKWRWRLVCKKNGQVLANSESYATKGSAVRATKILLERLGRGLPTVEFFKP